MNKSIENLTFQLSSDTIPQTPVTHKISFAFTKLWNQVVITFIGQSPKSTKGGCRPSVEERIAHAVYGVTERLFLSYIARMAGEIDADDTISRYDLSDGQLAAVIKWLRMGQDCGSEDCVKMRRQERRRQVVEWLDEIPVDIWAEVEKKVPKAALRAQWKGEIE